MQTFATAQLGCEVMAAMYAMSYHGQMDYKKSPGALHGHLPRTIAVRISAGAFVLQWT